MSANKILEDATELLAKAEAEEKRLKYVGGIPLTVELARLLKSLAFRVTLLEDRAR